MLRAWGNGRGEVAVGSKRGESADSGKGWGKVRPRGWGEVPLGSKLGEAGAFGAVAKLRSRGKAASKMLPRWLRLKGAELTSTAEFEVDRRSSMGKADGWLKKLRCMYGGMPALLVLVPLVPLVVLDRLWLLSKAW